MDTDTRLQQFYDQYDTWLRDTIAKHGWVVQHVGGCKDDCGPEFAYTVGLSAIDGHPELLVAGLCHHDSGPLLNVLGKRVRDDGLVCRDGQEVELAEFPGTRFMFVVIPPSACELTLTFANGLLRDQDGPPVPALQVVWSDEHGHWPWEESWSLAPDIQLVRPGG
jgi:hypothetical protein